MMSTALHQNPFNATFAGNDEFLVFNLGTGKLHHLNSSAALIFELCDGRKSADDIIQLLNAIKSFDAAECKRWIGMAIQERLLSSGNSRELLEGESTSDLSRRFAARADTLRDEGLVLAAFCCQNQAVMLQPAEPDYWLGLGELAHILGRRDKAREAYERHLKLHPDNAEASHILLALSNQQAPDRAPDECILQLYARFSEFYEDNMCSDLNYEAPIRIQELLERHLTHEATRKVLELGCGTGLAGRVLRPYASHLKGIDLSPEMITKCRAQEKLYDTLHVAEITSFLADQIRARAEFDLVVACDTLIYFGDLKQVLEPVSMLLSPAGWMLFTVEKGDMAPFKLTDSGRYSHTESYLRSAVASTSLDVVSIDEGFLRYEYGEPVIGLAVSLRNKSTPKS